MSDEKRKTDPPLHVELPFGEALQRYIQTNPEEVEPPQGKKPKVAKAAKRLASMKHPGERQKGNSDQRTD